MKPVGEPDAGNPQVRFDERGRETGPIAPWASRAPAPVLDSTRLTAEARDRPAITSLRLLAVLTVLSKYASLIQWGSSSGARLALTGLSRTSPRHAGRVEDRRGCSGRLWHAGPVSRPRSSNRTCGFPASGSPTGFIPQAVAGGGPRCIRRRRTTPNLPNTTWSLNCRVPRDDTFFRLRKNPRTRSRTWLSTARYAISRVP